MRKHGGEGGVSDRSQRIRKGEEEAAAAEAQLEAQLAARKAERAALEGRLRQLEAASEKLPEGERPEPVALPAWQLGDAEAEGWAAREAALAARRAAVEKIRDALRLYDAAAGQLTSKLAESEAAVAARAKAAAEAEALAQQEASEGEAAGGRLSKDAEAKLKRAAERRKGGARSETPPAVPASAEDADVVSTTAQTQRIHEVAQRRIREAAARMDRDGAKAEARRPPRYRMQAVVDLSSESNFFSGFSTDISSGGLFVATVHAPPLGTLVDLQFTLPDGRQIEVKGQVRWTREVNDQTPEIFPGVGIQFIELSPDARGAIDTFVAAREPMFFPD
jgi:uncharacterized protein (TIGR02266 family)